MRRLLDDGYRVKVLVRTPAFAHRLQAKGAVAVMGDLRDVASLEGAVEDVDMVVHAAALCSPFGKYRDFYDTNVLGTRHLVNRAVKAGVKRFVHISSPSVVSRPKDQFDLDEQVPIPKQFVSPYSHTKALAEMELADAHVGAMTTATLRPKAIYGPGDTSIFPRIAASLLKKRLPRISGTPTHTNITHVSDVVEAICLALQRGHLDGETFFITGGEVVDLWEVIDFLADRLSVPRPGRVVTTSKAMAVAGLLENIWKALNALGLKGEPPLTRYTAGILAYSQTYNIDSAREKLGFYPRVSWKEGIESILQEFTNR
ncbi:MAG: NAD-dependent epimerase/dehydratase family protein [Deltaproteobacteria bacterium]|nr:NAD-dependent epimerase/dehydratase family protein [Deltaproteobacteria bacterium]